jgi:hypothetical protein
VKYADDLVLLAKDKLYYRAYILIETGRCYGMEMVVDRHEVMRISRQPSPVQIMIDPKNNWRMWSFLTIWVA